VQNEVSKPTITNMAMNGCKMKWIETVGRWHISKIITAFTCRTEKSHEQPQTG
jgi:hypothetical protein